MMAALAGGAALMGRGKKKFGTDAGFLKSGAAGGASLADLAEPAAVTGVVNPNLNKVVAPANDRNTGNTITRTSGITTSPSGQLIGAGGLQDGLSRGQRAQAIQAAANAPKGIYPPGMIPMRTHTMRGMNRAKGGRIGAKKGGSVKKAKVTGIAKRGFGRALMKGKK